VTGLLGALAADDRALVVAIVLARLLVPLLIPRFPLVIVVALVLDAVDNSLLAQFTAIDLGPDGSYQSFDKALDIYYLSIAELSMLRNWTSAAAAAAGVLDPCRAAGFHGDGGRPPMGRRRLRAVRRRAGRGVRLRHPPAHARARP
jgi:hypothetical protein